MPHQTCFLLHTGGGGAGLFYASARSCHHIGGFRCSSTNWHSESPHAKPEPASPHDLFARPRRGSQHRLGKDHQGQIHQEFALPFRWPHRCGWTGGGFCSTVLFKMLFRNVLQSTELHENNVWTDDVSEEVDSTVLYIPKEGLKCSPEEASRDRSLVQRMESESTGPNVCTFYFLSFFS